jgi:hypothetical protein
MRGEEKTAAPWSVPVAVEDVPETGLRLEVAAPSAVRAQIATLAAVRDLPELSAVFDLTPRGKRIHVAGVVKAWVGQTCVVSLESIENDVEETVDLVFAPKGEAGADSADDDAPEPLVGATIDVGALATEFLLLGIDPYPRKPGAKFAPPSTGDEGGHPFAALETLKKRLGGSQS